MAGFTTLGLMLGGQYLLSRFTNRNKNDQQQQNQLAPGPTNANAQNPLAPPAPPILNPADVNSQALQAGARQRKRAGQGSLLTAPMKPASTTPGVAPRYAQRTLLGQ